ncbi:hypothetical protein ABE10_01130, partial [Bacillus toyonensis]|nr:hypothetical protein [Bacillus toyonensis]
RAVAVAAAVLDAAFGPFGVRGGHPRVVPPVEGRAEVEVLPVVHLDRRRPHGVPVDRVAQLVPIGRAQLGAEGARGIQPRKDAVVIPQMGAELRTPEVLVPGDAVVAGGAQDPVQHGLVCRGVQRIGAGHPLQRLDELRGVAGHALDRLRRPVVQVEHPDLAPDEPAGAACDVERDRVQLIPGEGERRSPGDIGPERSVGEQHHAVSLAVQLCSVRPEAGVGLHGLLDGSGIVDGDRGDDGGEALCHLVEVPCRQRLEDVVRGAPGAVGADRVELSCVVREADLEGLVAELLAEEHRDASHRDGLPDLDLPPVLVSRIDPVPVTQRTVHGVDEPPVA